MADLMNQRVLIYRGKDAGITGTVVGKDVVQGVEYVTVAYGYRGCRLHVRATDVRMASCLDVPKGR